ncbi:MAG: tetratricopeptide repeat protein [Acidobacteria bacterium]|nr:tetratricopeptide repeat protein [Acidobacteriota bacterium]
MRVAAFLLTICTCLAADWLDAARKQGAALERERQWSEAAAVYRHALERGGDTLSPSSRFVLRMSLSETAFYQGDYIQSWRWLRDAETGIPATPEARAQFLNARCALYSVEGKLTAAEHDLTAALDAARLAAAPLTMAATLHNLASLEAHLGALPRAEEHEHNAIALWRDNLGANHEYVRRAWISLSTIQGLRGNWSGAAESLRYSLAVAESPDALANYAVVLDRLHRGKEAREIRKRLPPSPAANGLVDLKSLRQGPAREQIVVR